MAYNSISGYNTTRITGLASGMDTDTLVKNLMQSEQSKIDRLYKQNAKLEWKKEAYTGINSQLKDFRNKFMSATSSDNIFAASAYRQFKVNMEANKYLDIKGTSLAAIGSHSITGFKMAEAATAQGTKHRNRTVSAIGTSGANMVAASKGEVELQDNWKTVTLENLKDSSGNNFFNFDSDKKLKFKINDKEFSFDATTATLDDVINEVNSQAKNVKMSVDSKGFIDIKNMEKGANVTLKLENMEGSPRVFADNGVFGSSYGTIKSKSVISTNMTLAEIEEATGKVFGTDANGKVTFKINDETFSFSKDRPLRAVLDEINENKNANVTISYSSSDDKFIIKSNSTGAGSKIKFENVSGSNMFGADGLFGIESGTATKYQTVDRQKDTIKTAAEKMGVALNLDSNGVFSFAIRTKDKDGKEVTKDFSFNAADTTLQKMIDTVNGDSTTNVKLNYSQITDSFTFTSGDTGTNASFMLINKSGSNAFGDENSFFGVGSGNYEGSNAILEIDGERVEQASNTFVLDGLEFTLKSNFNSSVNDSGEVVFGKAEAIDFSVSQDTDSVVSKVKNFVEEYNQIVAYLNELISEEIDYDYEPLTEEERKSLTEAEVDKWDAQAKKGILRNDNMISRLLTDMRTSLFEVVGDTGLSPHDIGLTTGAWTNKGQITFNEDKFRAALAENPEKVAQVMAGVSESSSETTVHKESGILTRFYDQMTSYESNNSKYALKNTTEMITQNETSMQDMLKKMYQMEENYYQKFAQMEALMTQYQNQSTWLSQQLGSLG